MTVMTYLDLSTAHLRHKTAVHWAALDRYPLVANYTCGLIVAVPDMAQPDTIEALEEAATPDDLITVLRYAHSKGCSLIRFDADGEQIDDLPTYNW